MTCSNCGNPLKVISGGNKIVDGKIVMIHVWGCLNDDCKIKMQEQNRTQTEVEQFEE
jgi:hypothetical protein